MKTIAEQLADALRDAILCVDPDQNPETFKCAREALAAYDAQQAQAHPVAAGAWSANAGSVWDHTGKWIADCNIEHAARIVQCVNAHDALVSALRGVMPYAENEVSAILDLADDGDEHADEDCEQATAALESARAALVAAGVQA